MFLSKPFQPFESIRKHSMKKRHAIPVAIAISVMVLSAIFAASSCDGVTDDVIGDQQVCVGALWGFVYDTNDLPISGVHVSIADGQGTAVDSNEVGIFFSVAMNTGENIEVKLEKDGYATITKPVNLTEGIITTLPVRMKAVERKLKKPVNEDLDETLEDGSRLHLPAGSLVDENGNDADGQMEVNITGFRSKSKDMLATPGKFVGKSSEGQEAKIKSVGMMDVNLTSGGQKLELKPGQSAQIDLAVPPGTAEEGDVIGSWYYDDAQQKWIQQGDCLVELNETGDGLICSMEVNHFTIWNGDEPYPATCVKGRVVNTYLKPLAGVTVQTEPENPDSMDYFQTQKNGRFRINMEKGSKNNKMTFTYYDNKKRKNITASRTENAPDKEVPITEPDTECKDLGDIDIYGGGGTVGEIGPTDNADGGFEIPDNLCVTADQVVDQVKDVACGG